MIPCGTVSRKKRSRQKNQGAVAMSAVTRAPWASMLGQKTNNRRDTNPPHAPNSSLDQKKMSAPKVAPSREIIVRAWKSITDGSFPME